MKLSEFHVIKIKTNKPYNTVIYTDDIEARLKEEYENEDVEIVDEKDYTIDDYCTIVNSLLEDVNAHKYCNKIYDIIDTMRKVNIHESNILDFVKQYTAHMFELYGY